MGELKPEINIVTDVTQVSQESLGLLIYLIKYLLNNIEIIENVQINHDSEINIDAQKLVGFFKGLSHIPELIEREGLMNPKV